MQLLKCLVKAWARHEEEKEVRAPEVIAIISYGMRANGKPTNGTLTATFRGAELARKYPDAHVVMGSFSHSDYESENLAKRAIFMAQHIPLSRILDTGLVESTIIEMEAADRMLYDYIWGPRSVWIVAGEIHSRTVRYVWGEGLNVVHIEIIPYTHEVDSNSSMICQRHVLRWLITNIIRHALIRCFGITRMRYFRQPTGADLRQWFHFPKFRKS